MNFLIMVLILQWNAQSICAHNSEFKNSICSWTEKPDVICLQETWLKHNKNFTLPGYNIYRYDREITEPKKGGGGCAFLVKRGTAFKYILGSNSPIEFQIGEIYDNNKRKINIINVYNPCKTLDNTCLQKILSKCKNPCIICGDLNGHNPL